MCTGLSKEQATSSMAAPRLDKGKGKKPISSKTASKKGKAPSPTVATDEEEYEVESIRTHQWVRCTTVLYEPTP